MHLTVESSTLNAVTAPYELVKTMRASILVLGPYLQGMEKPMSPSLVVAQLEVDPVDLHLKGIEALVQRLKLMRAILKARGPAV